MQATSTASSVCALQCPARHTRFSSTERTYGQAVAAKSDKGTKQDKKFADAKRTERTFAVGDMVYLKMQPYRETSLGLRNSLKLTSKWYGPFRVLKKIGQVAYQLQLPEGNQLHDMSTSSRNTWVLQLFQMPGYH